MSEKYDLQQELSSLNDLLVDYHSWFFSVLKQALYPDQASRRLVLSMPSLFVESLKGMEDEDGALDSAMANSLTHLKDTHHRLQEAAQDILAEVERTKQPLEQKIFENFSELFKVFVNGMQKACQNHILEEWGLDILTALKSRHVMIQEISQEMERVARQGRSFAIALARIDHFKEIDQALGRHEGDRLIKLVADFIGRSLRIFDTAYRLDRDHFILLLKQSDLMGGQKALERLRDQLEKSEETYVIDGEVRPLTMSCCVAMPAAEDNIQYLLEDLRKDLDTQVREKGAVLAYYEMSPLQRFMKTGGEN